MYVNNALKAKYGTVLYLIVANPESKAISQLFSELNFSISQQLCYEPQVVQKSGLLISGISSKVIRYLKKYFSVFARENIIFKSSISESKPWGI